MERRTFPTAPCSLARSLDVIGDWWTPLIIRECLYGTNRFDDMQSWLGIGRNILARRLKLLVEQGVLEKRLYQERPPRHGYHLTEKGYDAAQAILAMMPFGERWYFEAEREPIHLFSRKTGKRVQPRVVDAETGEPLDVRDLVPGPGPAFRAPDAIRRARFRDYYARQDGAEPAPAE